MWQDTPGKHFWGLYTKDKLCNLLTLGFMKGQKPTQKQGIQEI